MYFLDPGRCLFGGVQVDVDFRAHRSAVAARQRNCDQALSFRGYESRAHVWGASARRDPERHIPWSAESFDLSSEHLFVTIIVSDGRHDVRVRGQTNSRKGPALTFESAYEFGDEGAEHPRRFLHYQRRELGPPESKDLPIASAAALMVGRADAANFSWAAVVAAKIVGDLNAVCAHSCDFSHRIGD